MTPSASTNRTPPPESPSNGRLPFGRSWPVRAILLTLVLLCGWLAFDWWSVLPDDVAATYVGRQRCIECHQQEYRLWQGSDHDLAMDHATPDTVLASFDDVKRTYQGTSTHFFRRGDQYWVNTEGADGQPHDFQIKFVFGIRPLQQYLVELERPANLGDREVGKLQVLRWSWDTQKKEWFHLNPPDVPADEKLSHSDPLHWTGAAQNWNHMCADCHSTNVQKNFDIAAKTYRTNFSEIDVSCEACHGPGSIHADLASARSFFWDRKRDRGIEKLTQASSRREIETCAPCHSRRSVVHPGTANDNSYWDRYDLELLSDATYYADGQIRDEVYEFGSFSQSKMYHKGIRCTDCHDAHTTRVHYTDNRLCTSCHAHAGGRYDTPAHHHHAAGSEGSRCVSCHMPETPYMEVDLRRDHGLRVPRPDLSVSIGIPNACTGCHLRSSQVPGESLAPPDSDSYQYYSQWMDAKRKGNSAVQSELARVDQWANEWFLRWYGDRARAEHAVALAQAWQGDPQAIEPLQTLISKRDLAGIVRASALNALQNIAPEKATSVGATLLRDADPLVQVAALRSLRGQLPTDQRQTIAERLLDGTRLVRMEAAQLLAGELAAVLSLEQQQARYRALQEYREGLRLHGDQSGAHLELGLLAERMGQIPEAIRSYRTAVHVQPGVVGPRSNLASLLEQQGQPVEAAKWRAEELPLLARDANLAPTHAATQYRYALALYLNQQPSEAVESMRRAASLVPNNYDFGLGLVLLLEHTKQWDDALRELDRIQALRPNEQGLLSIRQRIEAQRGRP